MIPFLDLYTDLPESLVFTEKAILLSMGVYSDTKYRLLE